MNWIVFFIKQKPVRVYLQQSQQPFRVISMNLCQTRKHQKMKEKMCLEVTRCQLS